MIGIESQGKHYWSEETFTKHPLSRNLCVHPAWRDSKYLIPLQAGFLWLKSSRALIWNEIGHFSKVSREFNVAGDMYGK